MAGDSGDLKVCILDYGSGNVRSVYNLLATITERVKISNSPDDIAKASHLILPGVGAFGSSMARIKERIPLNVVEQAVFESGRPFLGICVGFQVLADVGFEFGEHAGLGWLEGSVHQLETADLPLPHVGWNSIEIQRESPLLAGIRSDEDFYFVHSYGVRLLTPSDVVATTSYGHGFVSVASRANIHGVQFHPEKSQKAGRRLLENFLRMPKKGDDR